MESVSVPGPVKLKMSNASGHRRRTMAISSGRSRPNTRVLLEPVSVA